MDRLGDLEAFVAIVETGGQTAAARRLRRSLPSINRSLSAVERNVGMQLVRRTTRKSHPTEAGLSFYNRIKPALTAIEDARLQVSDQRSQLSGLLRISAPIQFASVHVAPVIKEFMQSNPEVAIELRTSDQPVDVVEGDLDFAVRIRELPDSSLKVRRLGELRIAVFAARKYFEKFGRPRHPGELMHHECVVRLADGDVAAWPFRISGRRKVVRVAGRFRTDSTLAMQTVVAQGFGIGRAPLWQIRPLVEQGVVDIALEEFEADKLPIYAVLPPARFALAKTRSFLGLLAARIKRDCR